MEKINVILVNNNNQELEKQLNEFFKKDEKFNIIAEEKFDVKTLDKIGYKNPDVLIINTHKVTQVIIDFIERIYITKQGCAIILIANELNIDEMSKVLEAGANKALCAPIDFKELSDSIILSFNREKTRISKNQAVDKTSFLSKVISVFGTKGGVDKTTLAVNLAVSLAKARKKLAILDLDLQFGDVGIFLDIDTADTIVELVQDNSDLDINTIKSYMVIHSTGINVLLAPKSPELAELVNSKSVEKIINTLKNYYDYIIIDNPPAFNDISLVALENSSAVLFVTNLDISSLKNTRVSFDILSSLGMLEKVLTVVNKDGISTIKTKDAKKILDKDIFSIISNDNRVAVKALNRGVPIVLDSPKSVVSSAINSLAYKILDNIK